MTAGGKNVAPAVLEDRLRAHPLVDQCLVVGDGRPFIAALVTLDPESVAAWAEHHGKRDRPGGPASTTPTCAPRSTRRWRRPTRPSPRRSRSASTPCCRAVDRGGWPAHPQPQAQARRRDARAPRRRRRSLRRLTPRGLRPAPGLLYENAPTPPRAAFTIREASRPGPPDSSRPHRRPQTSPQTKLSAGGRWVDLQAPKGSPPMDRRRILLIIAAVVAALGTLLVFLYVRNADTRAQESVDTVQVLTASQPIARARATTTPWPPARSLPPAWPRSQLLANVADQHRRPEGHRRAAEPLPG